MSDEQVCNLLKWCSQCGEALAVTQIFNKDTIDNDGDSDVYDDDDNVVFVCNAASRAAIRGNDTRESPRSYVVRGFCSMHCFLASAASEKRSDDE
jgi:hypothetical protein